jgi:inhibitor of KinA
VCYGGELGPDLEFVAEHNKLSAEEVIGIHSASVYLVYMIGFAPGFPYIGGMSGKIAAPRRSSPRLKIPAGSVGIAGSQTGIYPIETPGGWQLIGQTPLKLFQPESKSPSLLKAGDVIQFKPISYNQFLEEKEKMI